MLRELQGALQLFLSAHFDWSKENSRHSLNQSDGKPKPHVTWSLAFSRLSGGSSALTLSSNWLFVTFIFVLIGHDNDYIDYSITTESKFFLKPRTYPACCIRIHNMTVQALSTIHNDHSAFSRSSYFLQEFFS